MKPQTMLADGAPLRDHHAPRPGLFREVPLKLWLIGTAAWLFLSCLLTVIGHMVVLQHYEEGFRQTSMQLKQELESRLRVSDTLLFGLGEMIGYHPALSVDRFYDYALEATRRYPFVYTMSYQPKVVDTDRHAFELRLPQTDPSSPFIKDHLGTASSDWRTRQGWVSAEHRPEYYPWLIAAPALSKEDDALTGFDLLNDKLFGPTLHKAFRSGETEATAPFVMTNGEPAIGYVRAIYSSTLSVDNPQERTSQVTGAVTLMVRLNALLELASPLKERLNVSLSPNGNASRPLDKTIFLNHAAIPPSALAVTLLPRFETRLTVDSPYFPYELVVQEQVSTALIQPGLIALSFLLAGAVCSLSLIVIGQNHQARRHRQSAVDDLYRERGHAMVMLNAINDAVLTVDTRNRVRYLNPMAAELLAVPPEEAEGKTIDQVIQLRYEFARQAVADPILECLQCGQPVDLADNCILTQPGRDPLLIEGSVSPLFDRDGALFGAVMAFRNMAPLRQRMMEALETSEKRLRQHELELARVARINTMGEMASGIAHELNQPLSAIMSYCQAALSMLEDDPPDTPTISRALTSSITQADRAGQIIHRLRAFVTKSKPQWVPVDINLAVNNVLTLAEYDLRANQVHVKSYLSPGLSLVYADTIQIEQVILNLIRNGIDATHNRVPWAEITLESTTQNENVYLYVRDNGTGLSEEMLDHLFDPFFSTKKHGMGLGLTICQSIVESFGGHLSARNLPEGGAEFCMRLPKLSPSSFAQYATGEKAS